MEYSSSRADRLVNETWLVRKIRLWRKGLVRTVYISRGCVYLGVNIGLWWTSGSEGTGSEHAAGLDGGQMY